MSISRENVEYIRAKMTQWHFSMNVLIGGTHERGQKNPPPATRTGINHNHMTAEIKSDRHFNPKHHKYWT